MPMPSPAFSAGACSAAAARTALLLVALVAACSLQGAQSHHVLPTAVVHFQSWTAPEPLTAEPIEWHDPHLIPVESPAVVEAVLARGPLFFSDFPHPEALLRHQRLRELNGLAGVRLGSTRPESPFYLWPEQLDGRQLRQPARRRLANRPLRRCPPGAGLCAPAFDYRSFR